MAEKRKPRVIKRYANRKLYDMSESCYITHEEIANLVESGEEVKIIDNKTKEDLTTRTLTQILFEKERKDRRTLPLQTLRGLFQSGGYFIQNLRDDARENLAKVFKPRGSKDAEDDEAVEAAPEPQPEPEASTPAVDDAGNGKGNVSEGMREWLENSQRAVESLQNTLEERWNLIVNSLGHFDINHRRIAELERRVAELEEKLEHQQGGT